MGMFFSLQKPASPAPAGDDLARAILTFPVIMACAGGQIDDRDRRAVIVEATRMMPFCDIGLPRVVELFKSLALDLRRRGGRALVADALPHMTMASREAAFILTARIASADGEMIEAEVQTLMALAFAMKIPTGRVRHLIAGVAARRAA